MPPRGRLEARSAAICTAAYKGGTKKVPMAVAASMPQKTTNPTETRLAAPAPVAKINGDTPRMNDSAVIITARKRRRAASRAVASMLDPCFGRSAGLG